MNEAAAAILGAIVATLIIALIYAGQCWLKPFVRCGACDGSGYGPSMTRPCRWCDGATMRVRLGRRAFNYMHRLHRASTTTARGRS